MKPSPSEILRRNRERATELAKKTGQKKTRALLERAVADLKKRLSEAEGLAAPRGAPDAFTLAQMRVTLAQVKDVLDKLKREMRGEILGAGKFTAQQEALETMGYLERAEQVFRGVNQPLALDKVAMLDRAVSGAESTILNRIASDPTHPGQKGVLDRYGDAVIQKFEEELQQRYVQRTPWEEVKKNLTEQSTFLQGAPGYWAERIVRTEVMNANNRAGWESIRSADAELGDMVKILSATFDDRTGADSYAVHGQIRRPGEAFESWYGHYQHPPNRPNDREVVVPHRICWPIPKTLAQKSDGDVAARWAYEGRKGSPPGRPKMTTVDLALFGVQEPPKIEKPAVERDEEFAVPEAPPELPMRETEIPKPTIVQVPVKLEPPAPPPLPPKKTFDDYVKQIDAMPYDPYGGKDILWAGLKSIPSGLTFSNAPSASDEYVELHEKAAALQTFIEKEQKNKEPKLVKKLAKKKFGEDTIKAIKLDKVVPIEKLVGVGSSVHKDVLKMAVKANLDAKEDPKKAKPEIVVVKHKSKLFILGGKSHVSAAKMLGDKEVSITLLDVDASLKAKAKKKAAEEAAAKVASKYDPKPSQFGVLPPAPAPSVGKPYLPANVAVKIDPPTGKVKFEELPLSTLPTGNSVGNVTKYVSDAVENTRRLKPDSKKAIVDFTGSSYGVLRAHDPNRGFSFEDLVQKQMKSGKPRSEAERYVRQQQERVAAIYRGFDEMKPVEMTVYRGMGGLPDDVFQKFVEDPEFKMGAMSSSTRKTDTAKGFMGSGNRIFFTLKTKRGIPIETISEYPNEQEILLRGDARFRVVSRERIKPEYGDGKVLHIVAEEID